MPPLPSLVLLAALAAQEAAPDSADLTPFAPPSRATLDELRATATATAAAPRSRRILGCARPENAGSAACIEDLGKLLRPTTVVVSGGVSLGSHQAGVLHYLGGFLGQYGALLDGALPPAREPAATVNLATGASAGSINAFLTAMTTCREPVRRPEDSLFFHTWIPVGMEGLLSSEAVTAGSVLSRKPIEAAICRIRALWGPTVGDSCPAGPPLPGRWAQRPCRGRLAFNVTRVRARDIPLTDVSGASNLTVKRQTEKFLVEYRKPEGDRPPQFYAYLPDRCPHLPAGLYPLLGGGERQQPVLLDDVFSLLTASSSFPVAFKPVPVPHRLVTSESGALSPVDRTSEFIDGGVFDNTPLGIAQAMNACRAREGPRSPRAGPAAGGEPYYVFIEPDARGWRPGKRRTSTPVAQPDTVFGIYKPFLTDFVAVSRQAELLNALTQAPELRRGLKVPLRNLPTASGLMMNFLGFFEKDFRRFDFYLGMTDAWDHLRRATRAPEGGPARPDWRYELVTASRPFGLDDDPMFSCLRALRLAEPDDFSQVAPPDPGAPAFDDSCAVARGKEPNLLRLYRAVRDLRRHSEQADYDPEAETETFFALLAGHQFQFTDLRDDDGPVAAEGAQAMVRDRFQRLAHLLGVRQPTLVGRQGVAVAAKATANAFGYRHPRHSLELLGVLNGAGFGLAYLVTGQSGFRLEAGARTEPWKQGFFPSGSQWLGNVMGYAGLGYELHLSRIDPWQLSLTAGWEIRERTRNHGYFPYLVPQDHLLWRHGPIAHLRATMFQRFTVGLGFELWVDDCARNNACSQSASFTRGLESNTTERLRLTLMLGWRFLDLVTP
jgi:hypothetical protein